MCFSHAGEALIFQKAERVVQRTDSELFLSFSAAEILRIRTGFRTVMKPKWPLLKCCPGEFPRSEISLPGRSPCNT
jgi:hypothetical protein